MPWTFDLTDLTCRISAYPIGAKMSRVVIRLPANFMERDYVLAVERVERPEVTTPSTTSTFSKPHARGNP